MSNMVRCKNVGGHFYDSSKFESCPHCAALEEADNVVTVPKREIQGGKIDDVIEVNQNKNKDDVLTEKHVKKMNLEDAVNLASKQADASDDMDVKTVRFYNQNQGKEPVVGWLVGLNGSSFGEGYCLRVGRNFIGRGRDMDIVLDGDNTVSRSKHAIVLYEPKARIFIAQSGESRELFYVNGDVVLNNQQLKKNDILQIGKTKLMLIPCCDEQFCWEDVENER